MVWKLFSSSPRRHYLDWASAAPVHEAAEKAFSRAVSLFGNPSSPHTEGRAAQGMLEQARLSIARLAGAKPRAVIFTSGATEANALAILGRAKRAHSTGTPYTSMHVLFLPTMHASARSSIAALAELGVIAEPIPLKNNAIDLPAFAALLRKETILVCADVVCGETGIRYGTLGMRRSIDASPASNAALMVDASQLPLMEPIDHTRLGADLLTLDAQKIGGVRGIGALIMPKQNLIAPLIEGGGQEAGLRPGTEPVVLAVAFAAALTKRARGNAAFLKKARAERALLVASIQRLVPGVLVNEGTHSNAHHLSHQAPHILNLSLPGIDTDYLIALLNRDGYAVSTKSACETNSTKGSTVVLALTNEPQRATSTLRISWGPETPTHTLRAFPRILSQNIDFLENT